MKGTLSATTVMDLPSPKRKKQDKQVESIKKMIPRVRYSRHVSDTEIDRPFFEQVDLKTAWSESFNKEARRNFLLRPYIYIPVRLELMH